jgi:hypothetical protein
VSIPRKRHRLTASATAGEATARCAPGCARGSTTSRGWAVCAPRRPVRSRAGRGGARGHPRPSPLDAPARCRIDPPARPSPVAAPWSSAPAAGTPAGHRIADGGSRHRIPGATNSRAGAGSVRARPMRHRTFGHVLNATPPGGSHRRSGHDVVRRARQGGGRSQGARLGPCDRGASTYRRLTSDFYAWRHPVPTGGPERSAIRDTGTGAGPHACGVRRSFRSVGTGSLLRSCWPWVAPAGPRPRRGRGAARGLGPRGRVRRRGRRRPPSDPDRVRPGRRRGRSGPPPPRRAHGPTGPQPRGPAPAARRTRARGSTAPLRIRSSPPAPGDGPPGNAASGPPPVCRADRRAA